ncbi:MAG TPA: rhomboid family intramembrane serine protease [Flavobacteriaceae bacterium]|nr:rhomboid family intramembrane serine protease [Flavobacteriaceae bacterium]
MGRMSETIKVLIVVNVLFFIGTLTLGDQAYALFSLFYFENPNFQVWQPLTHMFMHGGLFHILFNMYALWAFGTPLEIQWGRKKFLFFYFSAGLGAALIHTLVNYYHVHAAMDAMMSLGLSKDDIFKAFATNQYSGPPASEAIKDLMAAGYTAFNTPAVGASGAIYGVLVAFGMMYPNVELMLIFLPVPIKAKYFIPGLIVLDLFFGLSGSSLGIAHWAHIGGALFGFIMAYYWKRNSFDSHRWN